MVQIRRRRKKYGPVNGKGRASYIKPWRKAKTVEKPISRRIPAGTTCHVRKIGTVPWLPHTTTKDIICHHYLWRNETHYGLTRGEYEIKVQVGLFVEILL